MSQSKEKERKEQRAAAVDEALIKLYKSLEPNIKDPVVLACTVAKVYAQSMLMTYKQSVSNTNLKKV